MYGIYEITPNTQQRNFSLKIFNKLRGVGVFLGGRRRANIAEIKITSAVVDRKLVRLWRNSNCDSLQQCRRCALSE